MESSKRQARLDRRRTQQRQSQLKWLVYGAIAAVVLIVLLIFAQQLGGPRSIAYTQKDGLTLGSADAPVTLFEFVDFQCSFCLNAYNTTEQPIIEEYVDNGQVQYTYHLVGLLGPESIQSAEAAYCAADQNYFWEYHDVVFAPVNYSTGNTGGYTEDRLIEFARKVNGLNIDSFTQCLASDENLARVDEAFTLASSFGITGTPGYVINGVVLPGFQSLEALRQTIENELAAD
ncbi:MAG: DsbA family protein [Anaerolineales bacterium]